MKRIWPPICPSDSTSGPPGAGRGERHIGDCRGGEIGTFDSFLCSPWAPTISPMTITRPRSDAERLRHLWNELAELQVRLGALTRDLQEIRSINEVDLLAADHALRRARFLLDNSLDVRSP